MGKVVTLQFIPDFISFFADYISVNGCCKQRVQPVAVSYKKLSPFSNWLKFILYNEFLTHDDFVGAFFGGVKVVTEERCLEEGDKSIVKIYDGR